MKAKDLMIPIQDYLRPDNILKEAVNLLKTAKRGEERIGVKGLPVLDEKGKLVGMLSMRDILKAVFPFYMSMMTLGDFTWDGMVESIAKKSSNRKVGELMSKVVISVDEQASLMECVDHMVKHNIKRLPVINKEGKVAGMLYERDVFFAITKAMLEENNGDGK
ncbi:CBS domain-containing protein [Dissulfurispira sp.]|uniref:CBS domain-containing protein n=1 Tax=Dissulfurispira sp. TaxID=2817609 RepID=UPI002FDA58D4